VCYRAGLDDLEERKICPCQDSNPGSSSPWPSKYTEYAIRAVSFH